MKSSRRFQPNSEVCERSLGNFLGLSSFRRKIIGREKCLILVMLTGKQTEHAEMILSHNKYFGYNGIICMS